MKAFIALVLAMFSFLGRGYEVVVASPDLSTVTIVSSTTTKMSTLKARRASKTLVAMAASTDINRVTGQVLTNGNYEVSYNRGTQTGTFRPERATRLLPSHDFQPPVPGEIVAARTSNGVITWTFSGSALELANGGSGRALFRVSRQ